MKISKCRFLLYQLYHQQKTALFQCLKWYSKYLINYTVSIPTKPKADNSLKSGVAGVVGIAAIQATAPAVSRAIRGLRRGGTVGMAKIDFFLFFLFWRLFEEKPLSWWR
ncbi:hypothetical protein IVG45_09595 [Methylomonas sp. LL1]|uniref:hypothetical protein n=1 Tax=Methylomonas sp. LL1 TaxID=2785785 RepID=UPI0018C43335|nr:hypothetical protein [Methylomonas sp. LL1]QPK65158.1 hypothetical protein IVG45_09595 [Methylomonas sp. LL1]